MACTLVIQTADDTTRLTIEWLKIMLYERAKDLSASKQIPVMAFSAINHKCQFL